MKHKISATDPATLAHEIAALSEATPADLKLRWRELYATKPPPRISRDLLTRAVAYRLQEKVFGGSGIGSKGRVSKEAIKSGGRRFSRRALRTALQTDLHRRDPASNFSRRPIGDRVR